jgi:hypothetical protein
MGMTLSTRRPKHNNFCLPFLRGYDTHPHTGPQSVPASVAPVAAHSGDLSDLGEDGWRRTTDDENARSALECGSSSYRLPPSLHTANGHGAEEERQQLPPSAFASYGQWAWGGGRKAVAAATALQSVGGHEPPPNMHHCLRIRFFARPGGFALSLASHQGFAAAPAMEACP